MNKKLIMRINKYFLQILLVLLALSGCKDDNTVEPVNNNNNNQNNNAPLLTQPANNSTITASAPLLKWDAFTGAQSYKVQLSMDANFITTNYVDTTITGTQVNVRNGLLTTGVNYYWRVIANLQGGGNSNWASVFRFIVVLAPPAPPNLISPPNNSTNQPFLPLFDWSNSPTAQTYRIQVSTAPGFSSTTLDSGGITVSQLQCPGFHLTTNTLYYWRVNA